MSLGLLVLAALTAVNPFRIRAAVPPEDRVRIAAGGAVIAWIGLAMVAGLAGSLLPAAIAPSTARMAVGVVLVLQGGWVIVGGLPGPEPRLPGCRAALVPVAFPVTLTPGLGLLALSASLDRSAPVAVAVLGVALALVPVVAVVGPLGRPAADRVLGGAARVLGAGLVLCGVALLVNGIFDV